jgi:hypothetical protein
VSDIIPVIPLGRRIIYFFSFSPLVEHFVKSLRDQG